MKENAPKILQNEMLPIKTVFSDRMFLKTFQLLWHRHCYNTINSVIISSQFCHSTPQLPLTTRVNDGQPQRCVNYDPAEQDKELQRRER